MTSVAFKIFYVFGIQPFEYYASWRYYLCVSPLGVHWGVLPIISTNIFFLTFSLSPFLLSYMCIKELSYCGILPPYHVDTMGHANHMYFFQNFSIYVQSYVCVHFFFSEVIEVVSLYYSVVCHFWFCFVFVFKVYILGRLLCQEIQTFSLIKKNLCDFSRYRYTII